MAGNATKWPKIRTRKKKKKKKMAQNENASTLIPSRQKNGKYKYTNAMWKISARTIESHFPEPKKMCKRP